MPAFDFWKKEVGENFKGTLNKGFALFSVAEIATADNKLKAILTTIKNILLWRPMLAMLGVGLISGLGKGIRSLVHDTGSLQAAMEKLKVIQGLEKALAPFTAGIENAKRKVAELVNFAAGKNMSIGEVEGRPRGLPPTPAEPPG